MITEGVVHHSLARKIFWWLLTFIKMLSLLWASLRLDRLFDVDYMRHHWKHYTGMIIITVMGWFPMIVNAFTPIKLENNTAYAICLVGLLYYPLSMTFFVKYLGPRMRKRYGKATTLKVWEYYISLTWQIQTIGFTVLLYTDTKPYMQYIEWLPMNVAKIIGYTLIIIGFVAKFAAVYMTGYNTYYWYDMILEIPNAHFIEDGIYKYCGSPTYTLGRGTGFGAAVGLKSIPMFVASVIELILITLYNYCVEQPFVRVMYVY